jgi:raffinose/stachyose/melibiose transport system permease protein
VPLLVAKLITSLRSQRLQYLLRVGFVVPLVVPGVVFILIWGFFYEPTQGLLNRLLTDLHLGGLTQAWLGDPNLALYCVMFMGFPWVDGFGLLIYTAGLQAIPGELTEAAAIDGANARQRFWHIEIPLILGQIRLMATLAIINGLQNFTQVLILTNGGPGQATTVPGLYLYQAAMFDQRMGYASAIAFVLFVIILLITAANMKFIRPATEFEGARAA